MNGRLDQEKTASDDSLPATNPAVVGKRMLPVRRRMRAYDSDDSRVLVSKMKNS